MGFGLKPKPLFPKSGPFDPPTLTHVGVASRRQPLLPRTAPPQSPSPGPGHYRVPGTWDGIHRKRFATMGLPEPAKRPPHCPPLPAEYVIRSVGVKHGTIPKARVRDQPDPTPGPGAYNPCSSDFCACTTCDGIKQGKTFGLRPPVYTGNIPWPPNPGAADYHVDCTTLGAATQVCDDV